MDSLCPREAERLTKALKGEVKTQGNWGEVILERILEESGLREGHEYITQGRGSTSAMNTETASAPMW